MLAETDIAARIIWLRKGEYCAPRIVDATRWTFSVNACAFRHTLNFLKSLIPNDGVITGFTHAVSRDAAAFYSRSANSDCPVHLACSEIACSGPRAAASLPG